MKKNYCNMENYERKYKEALGWMRSVYDGLRGATKEDAEHYFPELKENKSERVRKGLIKTVSSLLDNTTLYHTDITKEEAIAWLEKQDEQKPYGQRKQCSYCQFNYAGECKGFCQMKMNEQKHTDKTETKTLDADKVIEWLDKQACLGWLEDIEVEKVVEQFKKDFGL